MKRVLKGIAIAAVAGALASFAFGCGKPTGSVQLTEVSQNDIGRLSGISYYVVPEPAATAKCKNLTAAGEEYSIVGDLQSLYGEGGYPQAVMVAKCSLIERDGKFLSEFLAEYKTTDGWLAAKESYADVVTKINECGGKSLLAPMVTPAVVANCNVSFKKATDEKGAIKGYMQSVQNINPSAYAECEDGFFYDIGSLNSSAADESKTTITVRMPDGAPALSMAKMLCGGYSFSKSVDYGVVDASQINSTVTANREEDNADICILPVTAAVKLLGKGDKYKLLGTVTHGNIFIISSDKEKLTKDNLFEKLNGQSVGVVSLAAVPGLTLKMVLNKYRLNY